MNDQITKDMTIDEIFTKFPGRGQKLAQEMQNAGLNCVGCGASVWETLEDITAGTGCVVMAGTWRRSLQLSGVFRLSL